MRLIEKIVSKFAKMGWVSLENVGENLSGNETFVRDVIQRKGAKQFKYAGEDLRSDAKFILSMVEEFPDILEYSAEEIYDVYLVEDDPFRIEMDLVDPMVFATMCYKKNELSFSFFNDVVAFELYEAIKEGKTIKGTFQGEPFEYKFTYDVSELAWLEMLNPTLGDWALQQISIF